jgi:membrane-associated phospholipid phosphatase
MSRRTAYVVASAASAVLGLVVWALAFRTAHGVAWDFSTLHRLAGWQLNHTELPAQLVSHLCDTIPYAVLATIVTLTAVVTGGIARAMLVASILVVPNAVTQALKVVTSEHRVDVMTWAVHVDAMSWPSGHATASLSLALAAAIAAPVAYRSLVAAIGLALAAAVGTSVVLLGWHFPSDVLGGYCVAAAGGCLGLSLQATRAAPAVRWHPARG